MDGVCVCETERNRKRQKKTERDRERETGERWRGTVRDRETESDRKRETERDTDMLISLKKTRGLLDVMQPKEGKMKRLLISKQTSAQSENIAFLYGITVERLIVMLHVFFSLK